MTVTDLVAFLRAALDDDERVAQAAARTRGTFWTPVGLQSTFDARVDDHIARHDPARVLREVAAKRAILDLHHKQEAAEFEDRRSVASWCPVCGDAEACPTLRHLAAVYADRPGYDPAWAPEAT